MEKSIPESFRSVNGLRLQRTSILATWALTLFLLSLLLFGVAGLYLNKADREWDRAHLYSVDCRQMKKRQFELWEKENKIYEDLIKEEKEWYMTTHGSKRQ